MYDAVILAGGTSPWLKEATGTEYRAWAQLYDKPMALYIAEALLKSGLVNKVVIAGPAIPPPCPLPQKVEVIVAGDSLMSTVVKSLESVDTSRSVLFATDDIPMLTGEGVKDFIQRAEKIQADVCYTVIPKEAVEKEFPKAQRTYVKITDGKFTGGNIFLVNPQVVPACQKQVEEVFAKRKDIFGLCKWLGLGFIVKYFLGTLSLKMVEDRASELFHFKGRAIISNYASIGMDVDKLSDLLMAKQYLLDKEKEGIPHG